MPDNFEKWPVVALMAFIAIVSMAVLVIFVRLNAKADEKKSAAITALSVSLTTLSERTGETNRRLDELCEKQTDALVLWAGRPCLIGVKGDKGNQGDPA